MNRGICHQMTFLRDVNLFRNNFYCNDSNGNNFNMTENRKRSREDDSCEFMPLSKRINNLHINNNLATTNVSQTSDASGITQENGISSPSSSSSEERRASYDPGMSSNQSSYYYDNKLLFELHLERVQRCGQQFPY